MLFLTAADVRRALPMRAAIDCQKKAFAALSVGEADLPLRTAVPVPAEQAVTLFMPARVGGDLGAKVVSVFPGNAVRGQPVVQGVVLLVDAGTGRPTALLDATYLTALRTGAGSGAATDLLAVPDAHTLAILGTGAQATTQLLAVCAVRPVRRVHVFSRDPERVRRFVAALQPEVAAELAPAASAGEAVRGADMICAATTSTTPVLDGRDLRPGAHVNGVGSYTPTMQEVDAETVRRAGRVFVDSRAAALAEAGDVTCALQAGVLREADLVELGEVVVGRKPGRTAAEAITFFKSVGVAVQDVTTAAEVVKQARARGLGTEIDL